MLGLNGDPGVEFSSCTCAEWADRILGLAGGRVDGRAARQAGKWTDVQAGGQTADVLCWTACSG